MAYTPIARAIQSLLEPFQLANKQAYPDPHAISIISRHAKSQDVSDRDSLRNHSQIQAWGLTL